MSANTDLILNETIGVDNRLFSVTRLWELFQTDIDCYEIRQTVIHYGLDWPNINFLAVEANNALTVERRLNELPQLVPKKPKTDKLC